MFDHINTNVVYNMINICHVWHSWHFLSDLLQFSGHSWRLRASSLFVWTTLPVFLDSIVIVCDILLKTRCMFRSSFGRSTNDWNPSGSLPCQFFETFSLFTQRFHENFTPILFKSSTSFEINDGPGFRPLIGRPKNRVLWDPLRISDFWMDFLKKWFCTGPIF